MTYAIPFQAVTRLFPALTFCLWRLYPCARALFLHTAFAYLSFPQGTLHRRCLSCKLTQDVVHLMPILICNDKVLRQGGDADDAAEQTA